MSEKSFGDFGKIQKRKIGVSTVIKICFIASIVIAIPKALSGWREFYVSIAEHEAPQISFDNPPVGIGLAPVALDFKVKDALSGLDKVSVEMKTEDGIENLFTKSYPKRVAEDLIHVEIDPSKLKLKGKVALISIKAFDRSIWSSLELLEAEIPIDLKPPKIQAISTTNYLTVGGVGLVFYKVLGENPELTGVKLEEELFLGFPANYIDQAFNPNKNLYFAFFPVPLSCNEQKCDFKIFARDTVGNKSQISFPHELSTKTYSTSDQVLELDFVSAYLPNAIKQYNIQMKGAIKDFVEITAVDTVESQHLALSILLKNFVVEKAAKVLFSRPSGVRLWEDVFFYPGGSVNKPRFAENVSYTFLENAVGEIKSPGIFFSSRAGTDVRATNSGRVIFSGDYGLLGKSIIIDHGFGLSTVYSNLSTLSKLEGDKIGKGEVIGLSGNSGLTTKSGCMYQVRMHGYPVRPEEWWDPGWIKNRIFGQVDEAKEAVGLAQIQQ